MQHMFSLHSWAVMQAIISTSKVGTGSILRIWYIYILILSRGSRASLQTHVYTNSAIELPFPPEAEQKHMYKSPYDHTHRK
jgi:hypothetical protein